MSADLHLHSCFSDGTLQPEEIAAAARVCGITVAALTDHNTDLGFERFKAACDKLGVAAIRGMELDCTYNGRVIHMLGYGYAPVGRLMTLAGHSKSLLLEMSRDLVKKMSNDYPDISLEEYDSWDYNPAKGGWKGLHYLFEKRITACLEDGMKLYSQYGCDYSSYPFPSVAAVCDALRDAGGVPVLAHPGNWLSDHTPARLAAELDALRAAGMCGIECYYPSHTPGMTAACLAYCARYKLLVTAGSDCHGDFVSSINGVDYRIGAINIPPEKLRLGKLWQP